MFPKIICETFLASGLSTQSAVGTLSHIPKMSCEIKSGFCPYEIECVFSTDTKGSFALYFHSSEGSQEQVVGCALNGRYKCFQEEGFDVSYTGNNDVTITVPDSFATRSGYFSCHKGDNPITKTCPYPPPKGCDINTSTESRGDLGATTEGNSPAIPVAAIVAPIVIGVLIIIILIIIIVFWLFKRYRSEQSSENCKKSTIYTGGPSDGVSEECKKSFLGIENHVDPKQVDCASANHIGVKFRTCILINWDEKVLTGNGKTANVDQEHTSTDNEVSRALSGLHLTPPLSEVSTHSTESDGSQEPLISGPSVYEHDTCPA